MDDISSLDILELKDYGPENNRHYGYLLVIIDNFSKFGWTIPLKNKNAIPIKDPFENFLLNSRSKPNLIETDFSKEVYKSKFQNFLKNINIKILEIAPSAVFVPNASTVALENYLKTLLLNEEMAIGSIYYLQ